MTVLPATQKKPELSPGEIGLVTDWGRWADPQEGGTSARASLCLADSKACGSSCSLSPTMSGVVPQEQPTWKTWMLTTEVWDTGPRNYGKLCILGGGVLHPQTLTPRWATEYYVLVKTPPLPGTSRMLLNSRLATTLEISLSAGKI